MVAQNLSLVVESHGDAADARIADVEGIQLDVADLVAVRTDLAHRDLALERTVRANAGSAARFDIRVVAFREFDGDVQVLDRAVRGDVEADVARLTVEVAVGLVGDSVDPWFRLDGAAQTSCISNLCIYNNYVNISFDPAKDQANSEKHGVSLAAAAEFEWDEALTWIDERKDYGEERMCAMGYIGMRLFYVVYVDRARVRRIVSLRKANSREVQRYGEA